MIWQKLETDYLCKKVVLSSRFNLLAKKSEIPKFDHENKPQHAQGQRFDQNQPPKSIVNMHIMHICIWVPKSAVLSLIMVCLAILFPIYFVASVHNYRYKIGNLLKTLWSLNWLILFMKKKQLKVHCHIYDLSIHFITEKVIQTVCIGQNKKGLFPVSHPSVSFWWTTYLFFYFWN